MSSSQLPTINCAIYGVARLAKLYQEFTRETVFNTTRKYCLKPSMGGSYLGGIRKETALDKKSFRVITSIFCKSDAEINGTMPIAKLYYFKCKNQDYYKHQSSRYFKLIKYHLIDMDRRNNIHEYPFHKSVPHEYESDERLSGECLWCFFPMYWTEKKHLLAGELSAFVFWFSQRKKPKPPLHVASVYPINESHSNISGERL